MDPQSIETATSSRDGKLQCPKKRKGECYLALCICYLAARAFGICRRLACGSNGQQPRSDLPGCPDCHYTTRALKPYLL